MLAYDQTCQKRQVLIIAQGTNLRHTRRDLS